MTRTKKFLCAMGFGVASWVAMGPAIADDPKPDDQSKSMSMMEKKSAEATVVSVDVPKRHLVVKGDNGMEMTLAVPDGVKRLDEIKPGDKLKVDYYQSLALSLEKSAKGAPAATEKTLTERKAGALPGGAIAHQESGTVEITKIDKANNQLTVKRPNGKTDVIDVKDPDMQAELANLKEGDKIHANYTEAAVITVEREGKTDKSMKPQDKSMKPEEKSM